MKQMLTDLNLDGLWEFWEQFFSGYTVLLIGLIFLCFVYANIRSTLDSTYVPNLEKPGYLAVYFMGMVWIGIVGMSFLLGIVFYLSNLVC